MIIETEQLREKLEDELKKKDNEAWELYLIRCDLYYLNRVEELFIEHFKKND